MGSGASASVAARAVVLALPPRAAAPLVHPLAPGAGSELATIRFASTVVLVLGLRREDVAHPLDGYGLIVPRGEGLRTTAVSFHSTKFEGRTPEGQVMLRVFLGGTRDGGVLELPDAELVALALREMGPVLGLRGEPALTRVFRWPEATPQMEVGHLEKVARVERAPRGCARALPVRLRLPQHRPSRHDRGRAAHRSCRRLPPFQLDERRCS